MKNRIKELRVAKGFSQGKLAEELHVSQSMLSRWEHEEFDIPPAVLKDAAKFFDVSVDYLIHNDSVKKRQTVTSFGNVLPITTKRVPLLGEIACGKPIFMNEEYGEFADVYADLRCDFCLRSKGDSMIGAGISDGDIVFCRQTDMVDNGKVAAVGIGDEATLKRFYYYPDEGRIILSAENPAYPPIIFDGQSISEVRVLGEAVAYQSLVK